MRYFDRFWDTPHKRFGWLTAILALTLLQIALVNFELGRLVQIPQSLSDFQAVLPVLPLANSWLGRLVLLEFQMNLTWMQALLALRFPQILVMLTSGLILTAETLKLYHPIKKTTFLIILTFVFQYSLILGLIFKAQSSVDVYLITNNLHLIGIILMVGALILVLEALWLFYQIYDNLKDSQQS